MDIDRLRRFVRGAERLTISAAGRTLGLGPPAASARLAKLEHALGADLLHRSTRRVSLSTEGAECLPFARKIIAQAEAGRAAVGRGPATLTGTIRFAAPSTFAKLHIAPIVPAFMGLHPGLRLDLRLADSPYDAIEGSLDLALRAAPMADTTLRSRTLADDVRVLVAAPAYLAAHGAPTHPCDLTKQRLITFGALEPRGLTGPAGAQAVFGDVGTPPRLTLDDGASRRAVTLAGAGVSINSLWSLHRDLAEGRLVRVLPDGRADDGAALWLVYSKTNVLTPKVRDLIVSRIDRIGRAPHWSSP